LTRIVPIVAIAHPLLNAESHLEPGFDFRGRLLPRPAGRHEIFRPDFLPRLRVRADRRGGHGAGLAPLVPEGLDLPVGEPGDEFILIDRRLRLADAAPQGQR
jgi:hypothetical protein